MKATERHKLKENEFARSVEKARGAMQERQGEITKIAVALLVLIFAVAGYSWWRSDRNTRANQALASALAVYEMPVVPLPPPAPGSPPPVPQPGTFQTEQEKFDAALPKFLEALRNFMYWQNYDVRVRMDGKIDRVVLDDILRKRKT